MNKLVDNLIRKGMLRSGVVIDAFEKIDRKNFVPKDMDEHAYVDIPLPIGSGQTISQPSTVAFMLELLEPKRDQNVLDVGSGSGWTTALLSQIVGEEGKVIALELLEELCEEGRKNADKFHFVKNGIAEFHCVSGMGGYEKNAPYDRILVSASASEVPAALKDQLAVGGIIVIPIANEIWRLEKTEKEKFKTEKFPGFAFVPFVSH